MDTLMEKVEWMGVEINECGFPPSTQGNDNNNNSEWVMMI